MAKLGGFNAAEIPEQQEFSALPADWYRMKMIESSYHENSNQNGHYFKFVFEVTEGDYKKRRLWLTLNTDHPNEQTVEIAEKQLAGICRAVGILSPEDTEDLHDEEIMGKVVIKPKTKKYPEGNEIKMFKAVEGRASPSKSKGSSAEKPSKPKRKVSFD